MSSLSSRTFGTPGAAKRNVLNNNSPSVGEKRSLPTTTVGQYNKMQKTSSSGYQKLFQSSSPTNQQTENSNETSNVTNVNIAKKKMPIRTTSPEQTQPIPLPKKRLPLPPKETSKSPPKILPPTPTKQMTPDNSSTNLLQVVAFLKNEVGRLKQEIENIHKGKQFDEEQQKHIEFLKSQLISSEQERKQQNLELNRQIKQSKIEENKLHELIQKKEQEIKDLLVNYSNNTNTGGNSNASSDVDNENSPSSQESLAALCMTQQVKKTPKVSKNDASKKRLELISEILNKSDNDILSNSFSTNSNLDNSSIYTDEIEKNEAKIEQLENKLNAETREKEYLEEQIKRKTEELKKYVEQCRILGGRIAELSDLKEHFEAKEKQNEEAFTKKYNALKSLAIELKDHIEVQQKEITLLKQEKKERKTENNNIKQKPTSSSSPKSAQVPNTPTNSPITTPVVSRSSSTSSNKSIKTPESTTKSNKKNQTQEQVQKQSKKQNKKETQDEEVLTSTPHHKESNNFFDDDSQYYEDFDDISESITNVSPKQNETQEQPDTNDSSPQDKDNDIVMDDENDEDEQPILSVDEYAAQAYGNSADNSPTVERSKKQDTSDLDLSLSQEMDCIMGMSQYQSTDNIKQKHLNYEFSASPIQDLNADPSLREFTTTSALSKIESISSQ